MLSSVFIEVLLPIVVIAACGFAVRKAFPLDLRSLNKVSLYILSPTLIFVTLIRINIGGTEALAMSSFSAVFCLSIGAIAFLLTRVLRLGRGRTVGMVVCTMFMNSGNFGLPTAQFAFGDEGFQRALLYFIPQSILSQVLAVMIAQTAQSNDFRAAFRQIVRMPQIYAVTLGLIIRMSGFDLDNRTDALGSIFRGFVLLSGATLPFMLILLGMQLAEGIAIEERGLTVITVLMRLVFAPMLAWAMAVAFGLTGLAFQIAVLEASMPTAVNMILYALEFDARPKFVAGVVVSTTVLSLVTLTVLLTLLR